MKEIKLITVILILSMLGNQLFSQTTEPVTNLTASATYYTGANVPGNAVDNSTSTYWQEMNGGPLSITMPVACTVANFTIAWAAPWGSGTTIELYNGSTLVQTITPPSYNPPTSILTNTYVPSAQSVTCIKINPTFYQPNVPIMIYEVTINKLISINNQDRITASKIGIGTSDLSSKLTLKQFSGTSTEGIQLKYNNANWYLYTNAANNLTLSQGTVGSGLTLKNTNGALTMSLGDYWTSGQTSLALNTSASTNGYATIQSIKSNPSTYGILALNPSGGSVNIGSTVDFGVYAGVLNVYKNQNPNFRLNSESNGYLEFGVSSNDGAFASFAKTGDAVIRKLGGTGSLILAIPNNNGDGSSYIKFGDSNGEIFGIYSNKKAVLNGDLRVNGEINATKFNSNGTGMTFNGNQIISANVTAGGTNAPLLINGAYSNYTSDINTSRYPVLSVNSEHGLGPKDIITVGVGQQTDMFTKISAWSRKQTEGSYDTKNFLAIGENGNTYTPGSFQSGGDITLNNNIVFEGEDKWILHTRDDSKTLHIAPWGTSDWAWDKQTRFENNGNVSFSGNIGIGTTDPQVRLHVNGDLRVDGEIFHRGILKSQEINVEIPNSGWKDYVFDKSYKLMTLCEVEEYIKTNGHLPEIPSASDVEKDGINIGDMQAKLLQKIEELTLYSIDLKKENLDQQKQNDRLTNEIEQLKEMVQSLMEK